jgi:hypothetical protein
VEKAGSQSSPVLMATLYLAMTSGLVVVLGEWVPFPDWLSSLSIAGLGLALGAFAVVTWRTARDADTGWWRAVRRTVRQVGSFIFWFMP